MPRRRVEPGPGQESVWDYPRPPRIQPTADRVTVVFNGRVIADTRSALRVLETSHPPTYYVPPSDVALGCIVPADGASLCEWKGEAVYHAVVVGSRRAERAAWSYPSPTAGFVVLKDHLAFYPGLMDACYVGGELARAQPGGFYGGWITSAVVGPFKGEPGTELW